MQPSAGPSLLVQIDVVDAFHEFLIDIEYCEGSFVLPDQVILIDIEWIWVALPAIALGLILVWVSHRGICDWVLSHLLPRVCVTKRDVFDTLAESGLPSRRPVSICGGSKRGLAGSRSKAEFDPEESDNESAQPVDQDAPVLAEPAPIKERRDFADTVLREYGILPIGWMSFSKIVRWVSLQHTWVIMRLEQKVLAQAGCQEVSRHRFSGTNLFVKVDLNHIEQTCIPRLNLDRFTPPISG
jgi:hypothetical protein